MTPVLVISLPSAIERRASITSQLSAFNISFRFLDAVDGNKLTQQQVEEANPYLYRGQYGRKLSLSEIGCALSHIEAAREIVNSGHEFVCVLEDDVRIDSDIALFLDPDMRRKIPPFDVLRLCNARLNTALCWYATKQHGREIVAPFLPGYIAEGMIYSRAAAEKIVRHALPLRGPIDNMIFRDGYIPSLKILEIRPALVRTYGGLSMVQKNFIKRTPYAVVRKRFFEVGRIMRTIRNYSGAWGISSFFKLRKKGAF